MSTSLNRRTALTALAAIPTAGIPALAAAAEPHPDAELLRLCDEHLAAIAEHKRLCEIGDNDDASDEACGLVYELEEKIINTAATTMTGVRGKARCAVYWNSACDGDDYFGAKIALSLARDVVSIQARA